MGRYREKIRSPRTEPQRTPVVIDRDWEEKFSIAT